MWMGSPDDIEDRSSSSTGNEIKAALVIHITSRQINYGHYVDGVTTVNNNLHICNKAL